MLVDVDVVWDLGLHFAFYTGQRDGDPSCFGDECPSTGIVQAEDVAGSSYHRMASKRELVVGCSVLVLFSYGHFRY